MIKKIFSFILAALMVLGMTGFASADSDGFIIDEQKLLWDEQTLELRSLEIYDKFGIAVTYVSTESLQGLTGAELAQMLYDEKVALPDGILLLDCKEATSYYMHYAGTALDVFIPGDGNAMMMAYSESPGYDEAVRAYLETADSLLAARTVNRDLVLLEEAPVQETDVAEQPLLSLEDGGDTTVPEQTPYIPVDRQLPLVVDTAGILAPDVVDALNERASAVSEKYRCDVALVFVATTGGMGIQAFTDDFYDYNGYGSGEEDSGIMLCIAAEDRTFAVSTYGPAAYTFTDYGQVHMDEAYIPYLKNSDWGGAGSAYLSVCEELLEYERANGRPYDVEIQEQESLLGGQILLSLIAGFLLAFIPVGRLKKSMLNVRKQTDAGNYVVKGSFHLDHKYDRYITTRVTRVPKPKENNNTRIGGGGGSSFHTSSSGRSHGGHSGSF